MNAPLRLAVLGSLTSDIVTDQLSCALKTLSQGVFEAVKRAGAEVVFAESAGGRGARADLLQGVQGVIILGGADIDPRRYGAQEIDPSVYGQDPEADAFELSIMAEARARALPLLGICRGMQLLNVLCGGDLIQDLGAGTMHSAVDDNSDMTTHAVEIIDDSLLAQIYGAGPLEIRSGHHQAVGRLGAGLRVSARAEDGVIEAIEGQGFLLGVQWHPEDPGADPADFDRLLAALLKAAALRRVHLEQA